MDRNMKKWHSYKLSDVVRFNPSERLLKGEIAKKVPMDLLQPYTRGISGFEMASYTGGSKFRNGDTLMARITPCLENGKTAYVSMLDEDEVGFGSTEYIVFRNIEGITDNKFVYYFVTSPWFRDIAVKSMVGSSGRQRKPLYGCFLPETAGYVGKFGSKSSTACRAKADCRNIRSIG